MKLTKIILSVAFLMSVAATAQAEVIMNEKVPQFVPVFIPCADDGAGEVVWLEGNLHVQFREEFDAAGGYHWGVHFQPMGMSGIGEVTGDMYRATGGTFNMENGRFPGCPFEWSFVNNYKIIGQGPGNNYLAHDNVHVVVDADCNLTLFHENSSIECK